MAELFWVEGGTREPITLDEMRARLGRAGNCLAYLRADAAVHGEDTKLIDSVLRGVPGLVAGGEFAEVEVWDRPDCFGWRALRGLMPPVGMRMSRNPEPIGRAVAAAAQRN